MKSILALSILGFMAASLPARAETCTFTLAKDSLKVGWTAYKTTEKKGVSGTFKKVAVKGGAKGKTLAALLESVSATIDRKSVDSGNPGRDQTLQDFFFQKLAPAAITGRIKKVSETDKTFNLALSFNGQKSDVPMTYTQDDKGLHAKGTLSLPDFQAQPALDSLHEKCVDLHKGPDGVSKTWPDVEVSLEAMINSRCK